ncbi:AMP-binding protein [Parafrankia elaeagni]|uniref:AMP-binding protein n=1 Tax=Parafrankia elaeagni TaxID=222534 RepID=UPI000559801C|nr:AMP-binding protein [Parafrankia elaeagni]
MSSPLRSPHPDVVVPDRSLIDHLLGDLGEDADRTALVDGARSLTFRELRALVDSAATGLAARVGPGEVAALVAPNSIGFVVAFLGALRAGVTVTPVNVLATADEVARQVTDSGAQVVLASGAYSSTALEAVELAGPGPGAAVVLEDALADWSSLPAYVGEPVTAPATHLAVLPYSSGTTGRPKGVMLTHRNLVANLAQIEELLAVGRESVLLGVLPFSHIYGMTVVLHLALRRRATLVVVPRFDLEAVLGLVEQHRMTHLFVAPPVVLALAKSPEVDAHDLSSVAVVLSGAAPLDEALASAVADRLDCQVRQAYGMSEMSPVSHLAPVSAHLPASSVGWTVPNMSIRLVDVATGADIEPPTEGVSTPGELCCSGPNVMAGYLGNEAETRDSIDELGYLHTGDIATVSADGVVRIVDRLKELIKYKGYQVAPAELEGLLLGHPDIADAAVVGIAQGTTGDEWPKAFVVPSAGASLDAEQVITYVADRVAPYKKVRIVEFVDAIPKSASGKILRRELRTPAPATI